MSPPPPPSESFMPQPSPTRSPSLHLRYRSPSSVVAGCSRCSGNCFHAVLVAAPGTAYSISIAFIDNSKCQRCNCRCYCRSFWRILRFCLRVYKQLEMCLLNLFIPSELKGVYGLLTIPAGLVFLVGVVLKEQRVSSFAYEQNFVNAGKAMWKTLKCPDVWRPCCICTCPFR